MLQVIVVRPTILFHAKRWMVGGAIGLLTFLLLSYSSPLYAQDTSVMSMSQADLDASIGRRLRVVIAALGLASDQTKYWPPIEDAVRAGVQARYERVSAVLEEQNSNHDVDVRTKALVQRAAELKSLVDAWQPLYLVLTSEQKQRVHLLARLNQSIGRLFLYTL